MTGVSGWFGCAGGAEPAQTLAALGGEAEARATALCERAALSASGTGACELFEIGDRLVAVAGRPRWAGSSSTPPRSEIAERIAQELEAGPHFLDSLHGDFAVAACARDGSLGLLAVDRMGVWDVAYAFTGRGLVFAPGAGRVALDPRCKAILDPQAIHDYLFHHVVPRPWTAYRGIYRLCPGEYAWLDEQGTAVREYWMPRFPEDRRSSVKELEAEFRDRLRDAVGRCAGDGESVGAFLSGGTDSSTITGMLGEVSGSAPKTFAIGFDAPGYDESYFARLAARHFGAEHHEYYVTPGDVAAALPAIAAAADQPYGNASVVPSYYCARLAKERGVDVLLGGDGGDELFAGNARYATQWLLSLYERVPSVVRRAVLEPAMAVPGATRLPPTRKVTRYIEQARCPLPDRLQDYNLLAAVGRKQLLSEGFLEQIDPGRPMEDLRAEYARTGGAATLNRLLALDFKYTLADDDLRKVTLAGALARVGTRFPFLDDTVVELAGRVPANRKLRGTQLRHFFKRALRDYLPAEILAKKKHGFGLPFGVWMREDPGLQALATDHLGTLCDRGLLRPAMVDRLRNDLLNAHASYYGTLVWILVTLEAWFRAHHPDARLS